MAGRTFMSIYMGSPQLDQLNDDMRAAELFREAPRLAVSEPEFKALRGESMHTGGRTYSLADSRETHAASSVEETLVERSLGSFRLEGGGLAFFAVFPQLGDARVFLVR